MKENFDDLLKRKWDEQHFPVDEQHRADMIALLDGQKRRKVFPFWWLGGLGLATIVAGYFMFSQQEATTSAVQQINNNREFETSTNNENIATENSAFDAHESSLKAEKSNTVSPAAAASFNHTAVSDHPKPVPTNKPSSSSSKLKSTDLKTNTNQKQPVVKQTLPIAQVEKESILNPNNTGVSPDGTFRVDDEAARSYQIVSKAVAVTIEDPEAEIEPYIPPKPGSRHMVNVSEIDLLDLSGIHYTTDLSLWEIKPKTSLNHMVYLFGETGVGMVLASKPDYSTGWKFRAGAGLGYSLSPKLQLSWSAGYLLQAGGFDFQRTSTVSQAGFGTRSSFNSLIPDKLHFVYTRLGAQYRLHRNVFAAHGGIQYLYGAQGDIVVQTHDQFVSGVSESKQYDWVKTDGLRKLHWTADVSYGYQLTPRLMASAGTDIYFSSFTVTDEALAQEGYYWKGAFASLHPFITLNYIFYGSK